MRSLDRPRRLALAAGIVLAIAGGALAMFAPEPPVVVPSAPGASPDAPALRYLFSLPLEGDPPLARPVGIAVGNGRLYVADSGAGVIRSFERSGADAGEFGGGVLAVPTYVATDAESGAILVSDRELKAVLRFGADGALVGEVRPSDEPTRAWEPLGLATDATGTVAVTDVAGHDRVLLLDRTGGIELAIGDAAAVGVVGDVIVSLDYPNSVGFVGDEVWVADSNRHRVLVFDRSTGDLLRLLRIDGVPRGLAFITDDEGALRHAVVVDPLSSEIVLVDEAGAEVARFGGGGAAPGRLAFPNDVAYEPVARRLYVADTGNGRVQVWEVVPAEEKSALERSVAGQSPAAMRLAGLGLTGLGAALVAVALWPRKRGEGTELAVPG